MMLRSLFVGLALGLIPVAGLVAQDAAPAPAATPAPSAAQTDLRALVTQIKAKLATGGRTAEALAPELATFDALLKKHAGGSADDAAQILYMKGSLYLEVIEDEEAAKSVFNQLIATYGDSRAAGQAKRILESLTPEAKAAQKAAEEAEKAKSAALIGTPAPQLDFTWSSQEGLKTLADLKGKVVVLDFWATWCGPCIAAFPKVREEVAHFTKSPVVILGVTSLQGSVSNLEPRPINTKGDAAKEYSLTADFMKKYEMTWPVVVSQQQVFNPDYVVRGIPHLTIIDPKGVVRYNGLNPHDPAADVAGKVTAILKEFGLPTPDA